MLVIFLLRNFIKLKGDKKKNTKEADKRFSGCNWDRGHYIMKVDRKLED